MRHRQGERCEDRIPDAKVTGLHSLLLTASMRDQIWVAVVELATELTASLQMLSMTDTEARPWEPKMRLKLPSVAETITRRSHGVWLYLSGHAPHRHLLTN